MQPAHHQGAHAAAPGDPAEHLRPRPVPDDESDAAAVPYAYDSDGDDEPMQQRAESGSSTAALAAAVAEEQQRGRAMRAWDTPEWGYPELLYWIILDRFTDNWNKRFLHVKSQSAGHLQFNTLWFTQCLNP